MVKKLMRRGAGDDTGIALVAVISLVAIMMLVVVTALSASISGMSESTSDQNSTGATDAAYAGVQDYLARVNTDSTYPQYGNGSAPFSATSSSLLTMPTTTNPAFGIGTTGTWATVPGNSSAFFRYEVDVTQYASGGIIRVRSTGKVGTVTVSVVATLKQKGFINYLYFTDYETQDPLITGTTANCAVYLWAGRDTNNCSTIQFAPGDVLNGPVRSNDTLTVCSATFNFPVTTGNPNTPIVNTPSGCGAGTYNATNPDGSTGPQYAPVLQMPATNNTMKAQTYSNATATPGCLYTGPTQITLNSDGTMSVVSPWTKYTNTNSAATSGSNPTACGSLSALHSVSGATITVPARNLVYVQSVPTSTTDVNYSATTAAALPTGFTCVGSDGLSTVTGSASSAGWVYNTSGGSKVQYPINNEYPATNWNNSTNSALWDTTTPAYGCRNGDVFVKGTISGQLTIAADNYVYATGDIKYNNASSDVLGLVGNNGVLVWNPMKKSGSTYSPLLSDSGREIDAAILSPSHTFQVQNYDVGGTRGTLTVVGSIAQRFRGPVGTSVNGTWATGYLKNYVYDTRYASITPPYYLKPASASYALQQYAPTTPAWNADGSQR